ncbi:immunoglobulin-like and fibronectin type III domain-containing protein 1 [Centroberyx gerrardi]
MGFITLQKGVLPFKYWIVGRVQAEEGELNIEDAELRGYYYYLTVAIKKRSRVPGVMITQYVEQVPAGKSTPDFSRKPMPLTVQEGKKAFFKAMVTGEPAPTVTWGRNKGEVADKEKYKTRYDERAREHILEIPDIKPDQADTYKCFATNEYGKAVCTATLNVMEAGEKKLGQNKHGRKGQVPQDFRSMLKKTVVVTRKKQLPPKKEGEIDPKLWELLLCAPKKDYEKICFDFGVTDFRWMLKRLSQMKKERKDEQAKVVETLENVKQIEVKPNGRAEFELDMTLWDPNSAINLYKDGTMVPYGNDENSKHSLKKTGTNYLFSINNPQPEDAGFYQVDVDEANVLTTDFQVPAVEFIAKIKDVKAIENEDAIFQCALSTPLNRITWSTQDTSVEHGDKYEITVSEDKLIHTLRVKDCAMADNGAYYAIAGIASSRASLKVEADPNAGKGRKATTAGDQDDLATLALEQQAKLQKQKDDLEAARRAQAEKDAADAAARAATGDGGDGRDSSGDGSGGKADGDGGGGEDKNKNLLADGDDEDKKQGDDEKDKKKKRVRTGPLVPDTVVDRGVQFVSGLSDTVANIGERAELSCKLSSETSTGRWYKNGKLLASEDGVTIMKDGACHKMIIDCCTNDDAAVYRFEAEGRKSDATLNIQDPPKIDLDALGKFSEPVIVKAGENAKWKLPFSGGEPMTIQWYKDDDELLSGLNVKIETSPSESQLRLSKCQRKDSGEVKIKIKNEFGTKEAISKLIVLDKPTPPQGPVDIMESAVTSVEFKWKPPKHSGGCPITNYIIERQQVGRNKWTNLGEIPGNNPSYKDSDVDPGRRYCYRIKAKNAEGISDYLETEDISAGVLRYPGPPAAPKVVSAFKDCINLTWSAPCDTGGTKIVGYNLEKHKKGTNYRSLVNQEGPIKDTKYAVKDVFEGAAYEFRVSAVNLSGAGEPSIPCDTVFARNPMKPPGKVIDLKLTSSHYNTFSLAWTKPMELKGVQDEAQGYYVEIRPIESLEWTRCNANPITLTSFTVLGLKAMATYWVRVIATNYGGDGEPQGFDNYIIAMPPPVRPKFKGRNMKNFVVVRSGNTVRLNIIFEASPLPDISWLKDGVPVPKHVTITNSDIGSQLLIPTSERSDTGIYTITVKNLVGQETFNVEIRVTDEPKPTGPVELEQNVPGTVTLSWTSSPDEKRDDRLHYMVAKRDSFKRTWRTVADNLFNTKCTVINILPGREYYFRVFAKNDMGLSTPTESPAWGTIKERAKFKLEMPETKAFDFQSPPSFIVPLKMRTAPQGYECYMSCAVKGDPAPRVTWYRNNISLNTNTNYYITNVCGVCSLLILKVGPKDSGEYKVAVNNPLGTAECSMMLNVRE